MARTWIRLGGVCALLCGVADPAHAVRIGTSSFSNFRIESFEHLTAGPNVGQQPGLPGVYLPGNGQPYRFASGVTLVGPSQDVFPGDPFVHDLRSAGAPPNNWGANGTIADAADVPFAPQSFGGAPALRRSWPKGSPGKTSWLGPTSVTPLANR